MQSNGCIVFLGENHPSFNQFQPLDSMWCATQRLTHCFINGHNCSLPTGAVAKCAISNIMSGVLNYFFFRATKGQNQSKDRCLRAKWSPLSYVFLCILELTKGQTGNGLRAGFGSRAAIWEGLHYVIELILPILQTFWHSGYDLLQEWWLNRYT